MKILWFIATILHIIGFIIELKKQQNLSSELIWKGATVLSHILVLFFI